MTENEIAKVIVDAAFKVHTTLGPGLLESAYQRVLEYELERRGLKVAPQVPIDIVYEGLVIKEAFVADIIVEDKVIIELKSVEQVAPVHKKQLLTYLKLTNLHLGLLINFNAVLIKDGITRIVHNLV
jgi:GxxExxY protein